MIVGYTVLKKKLTRIQKKAVHNSLRYICTSCYPPHKAGFVSIIGKPNVGKSSLVNKLVGENLSITAKAQTDSSSHYGYFKW
jgi:tRNA U34 5-carboxymethylaminomethyl modifying GTPase MnmE/TrmE